MAVAAEVMATVEAARESGVAARAAAPRAELMEGAATEAEAKGGVVVARAEVEVDMGAVEKALAAGA